MSVYANKFTIEKNDIIRIVCIDERAPIAEGVPMSSATVADVVMTRANAKALADLMQKILATET